MTAGTASGSSAPHDQSASTYRPQAQTFVTLPDEAALTARARALAAIMPQNDQQRISQVTAGEPDPPGGLEADPEEYVVHTNHLRR